MPRPAITPAAAPAGDHLASVRQRLTVTREAAASPLAMMVRGYRYAPPQQPGWHLLRERRYGAAGRPEILALTRMVLAADADPALRAGLEVYETRSHPAARALLLELLTGFQMLPAQIPLLEGDDHAEIALPDGRVHLSVRGNLVAVLTHLGGAAQDMAALAATLDAFLTAAPETPAAAPGGRRKGRAAAAAAKLAAELAEAAGPADAGDGAAAPEGGMLKYVAEGGLQLQDDGSVKARQGTAAALVYDEVAGRWRPR